MALSGNTREFSLADLIVVKAQDPRSHRLTLSGPAGDGLLLIESGRILHEALVYARYFKDQRPGDRLPTLVTGESSRMTVVSRGSSEPLAANVELEGRRSNRRVDVWILPH